MIATCRFAVPADKMPTGDVEGCGLPAHWINDRMSSSSVLVLREIFLSFKTNKLIWVSPGVVNNNKKSKE